MDEDQTRAVRLAILGNDGDVELTEDEVNISQEIEDAIMTIANTDSLDPIFRQLVANIIALAIVQGVTPHAVLQLLMLNVPPAETWPRELLQERFNA